VKGLGGKFGGCKTVPIAEFPSFHFSIMNLKKMTGDFKLAVKAMILGINLRSL